MKQRPTFGIATDGAHSTSERLTRFRAVDLSSGRELFSKSIGNWTNNTGEFLGIVEAVKYISLTSRSTSHHLFRQYNGHNVVQEQTDRVITPLSGTAYR